MERTASTWSSSVLSNTSTSRLRASPAPNRRRRTLRLPPHSPSSLPPTSRSTTSTSRYSDTPRHPPSEQNQRANRRQTSTASRRRLRRRPHLHLLRTYGPSHTRTHLYYTSTEADQSLLDETATIDQTSTFLPTHTRRRPRQASSKSRSSSQPCTYIPTAPVKE